MYVIICCKNFKKLRKLLEPRKIKCTVVWKIDILYPAIESNSKHFECQANDLGMKPILTTHRRFETHWPTVSKKLNHKIEGIPQVWAKQFGTLIFNLLSFTSFILGLSYKLLVIDARYLIFQFIF